MAEKATKSYKNIAVLNLLAPERITVTVETKDFFGITDTLQILPNTRAQKGQHTAAIRIIEKLCTENMGNPTTYLKQSSTVTSATQRDNHADDYQIWRSCPNS